MEEMENDIKCNKFKVDFLNIKKSNPRGKMRKISICLFMPFWSCSQARLTNQLHIVKVLIKQNDPGCQLKSLRFYSAQWLVSPQNFS